MPERRRPQPRALLAAASSAALAAALAWAVLDLPSAQGPLAAPVRDGAEDAGASNPVTAVLLAFRAYDTWLEVAVVLVAALGVLAVGRTGDVADRTPPPPEPVLAWMASLVVPAAVLVGGVMLWLGTGAPGGAFQAGAVLGAGALLLWLAGGRSVGALPARALAPLLAVGTAAFVALAALPLLAGESLLRMPAGAAGTLIVAVEAAVTVAVAVTLPVMVIAARARTSGGP